MSKEEYKMDGSYKSGNKRLLLGLLGGCVIIAIGLAIGLGIGLRARSSTKPKETDTQKQCAQNPEQPRPQSVTKEYDSSAVSSDAEVCSKIGSDMIVLHGGSVVDGAIAGLICNGVVTAHSMGIGGGFFMTIYNKTTGEARALDARETAPLSATSDMYISGDISSTLGGSAVAVPGELKGYQAVHQLYGKLPWNFLFQPTIKLCEEGVPITGAIVKALNSDTTKPHVENNTDFSMYFPNGVAVTEGEHVRLPKLANTLRRVATLGAVEFYAGELANDIVKDIQEKGGNITLTDLITYDVAWKDPVTVSLNGNLTVYSVPPPASGVVYEYILNILDGYNFTGEDMSTDDKTILTHHRIIESMKYAYAKRTNLGDDKFVNVTELVANMTSREFAEGIRLSIDDTKTYDTMHYGPVFYDNNKVGTSHLSAIDADGNAVSVTSTVNLYFGAKLKGNRTGIVFNNEMDDFSTPNKTNYFGVRPSPANFIQPGKRPLSSMCPSIVVNGNGDVVLIAGAAGGTKITTSTALLTLYTLKLGLPLQEAMDFPRVHHQLLPKEVGVEKDFPKVYLDGLKAKGHEFTFYNAGSSVVESVQVKNGKIYASSDWRKGGQPKGY